MLGIIGLVLITWGVTIRRVATRDRLFIFGGFFLLLYSIYIRDLIFIILQTVYIIITAYHWHKTTSFWQRLRALFT